MGIRYVYWLYLFDSLWRQPWMFVARECRNPHGLIIVNDTKKFGFNYFVQISWMAMRRVRAIEPNAAAATAFVCAYVCVCAPLSAWKHHSFSNAICERIFVHQQFHILFGSIVCMRISAIFFYLKRRNFHQNPVYRFIIYFSFRIMTYRRCKQYEICLHMSIESNTSFPYLV